MNKLVDNKILYIVPLVFLIVIVFRVAYSYYEMKRDSYEFALKQAEVLNSYTVSHRNYYQKLFINGIIPLNQDTLEALPAHNSLAISKTFSKDNPFNINIQTVSDRARNPENTARGVELKAIEFFNKNPDKKQYFSDDDSKYYQYASVLRVKPKCLECHGSRENAPLFIRQKYDKAYDYTLGEVRGIMSIKIPKKSLESYFLNYFIDATVYDLILFIALFLSVYFLARKSKQINDYLESEVKAKTDLLKNSLLTDELTKLPNRLRLLEDLQGEEKQPSKHLAILNIDRFKDINDFYGHKIGDEILQETAIRIKLICRNVKSEIFKLPGDEYAIFTTRDISSDGFFVIIQNIISSIQETKYEVEGNSIFVTISCGIASNKKQIITKADMALQIAKKDKRNIIIYDNSLDATETIKQNIKGVALLKDAIKNDNIRPYFQPIYNTRTKKIEKYEALVRIVQDNGEVIAPFKFLDIAIKSKLYPHITKTMIRKSFEFFKDKNYEFSINISINDILNKNTADFIIKSLEEFTKPERVVFEILESDKIDDYEELREFIREVKKFGCKIAIDDFGSGYSNFSHILELEVDYLKIDASLVKRITSDENAKKITQTIIRFASNLDLKTIAEFVENEATLNMLEEMGSDFIQGYYIGKPKPTLV